MYICRNNKVYWLVAKNIVEVYVKLAIGNLEEINFKGVCVNNK